MQSAGIEYSGDLPGVGGSRSQYPWLTSVIRDEERKYSWGMDFSLLSPTNTLCERTCDEFLGDSRLLFFGESCFLLLLGDSLLPFGASSEGYFH